MLPRKMPVVPLIRSCSPVFSDTNTIILGGLVAEISANLFVVHPVWLYKKLFLKGYLFDAEPVGPAKNIP